MLGKKVYSHVYVIIIGLVKSICFSVSAKFCKYDSNFLFVGPPSLWKVYDCL